jgi:Tfp pilus assembly protein PilN
MIEINLLPGTGKRAKRRPARQPGSVQGSEPFTFGISGIFERSHVRMVVAWLTGGVLLGWMIVADRSRKAMLESEITAAALDSTRLAEIIKTLDELNARTHSVVAKLNVVQEVDANRFVWPHLLDEIARAVPEHTWLVKIANLPTDSTVKLPRFSLEGRAGSNFALTRFLQQLELSPFIRQVRLKESQLVREDEKLVYSFALDADYETPPPDMIQTEPLFAALLDRDRESAMSPRNRTRNAQVPR